MDIRSTRHVVGDFEITAGYEIVQIDQPKEGHGVGVALMAQVASPKGEVLEVMRTARPQE